MKKIGSCESVCKYDNSFLNGQVCIGCFRELHEIKSWHKMSYKERKIAEKDILARKEEYIQRNNFPIKIDYNKVLKQ